MATLQLSQAYFGRLIVLITIIHLRASSSAKIEVMKSVKKTLTLKEFQLKRSVFS